MKSSGVVKVGKECGESAENVMNSGVLRGMCGEKENVNNAATTRRIRDRRQKAVADWCAAAFGAGHASSVPQRGIRLAEEAIEAAQAAGCGEEMVHKLVSHVFSNPPGDLGQELGGVGITLLALANAVGLSADEEEVREKCRVLAKPLEHFRKRNEAKNAAGFNAALTEAPREIA